VIDDIGIDQHYLGNPGTNQLLSQWGPGSASSYDCHDKVPDSSVAQSGQRPDLAVIQHRVNSGLLAHSVQ